MPITEHPGQATGIIGATVRWLAIVTGCFCGLVGTLSFGPAFLYYPAYLILAVIIQPYTIYSGRRLMWVGAYVLSQSALMFVISVYQGIRLLPLRHDLYVITQLSFYLIAVLLVGWCDVVLVIDGWKSIHAPCTAEQHFPRIGDWIVWVVAIYLNVGVYPAISASLFAYRHYRRLDPLLLALVYALVVISFDVALVIHALKTWRAMRAEETDGSANSREGS